MRSITATCKSCGGETLSDTRPTGVELKPEQREVALVRQLNTTEELREAADCRVRELEQAVRAFLKGKVKADVLGSLVSAEAF